VVVVAGAEEEEEQEQEEEYGGGGIPQGAVDSCHMTSQSYCTNEQDARQFLQRQNGILFVI
jgi:hypothetical protein